MTRSELTEKLNAATARKEKTEKLLSKYIQKAKKQKQEINDRGWNENETHQCYGTEAHDECYWMIVEYENTLEAIASTESKLEKEIKIIEKWNTQLGSAIKIYEILTNEMPEIFRQCQKDLAAGWTASDIKQRETMKQLRSESNHKDFRQHYSYNQELGLDRSDEEFEAANMKDAEIQIISLYNRVKEITGEVKDYSHIYYSGNCLNGFVIGEDGTAEVETILAGGYNIQRLHMRVLVKKR